MPTSGIIADADMQWNQRLEMIEIWKTDGAEPGDDQNEPLWVS
jgi:hypothetical protein